MLLSMHRVRVAEHDLRSKDVPCSTATGLRWLNLDRLHRRAGAWAGGLAVMPAGEGPLERHRATGTARRVAARPARPRAVGLAHLRYAPIRALVSFISAAFPPGG